MTQSTLKILLACAAAFVASLFTLHEGLNVEPGLLTGITALAIIFLELKAPTHKVHGICSTTFPLFLYLALSPQGSIGAAAALAILAFGLRTMTVQRDSNESKFWEFCIDAVSVCGALAVLKIMSGFGPQWNEVPVIGTLAASFFHFFTRPILQNSWLAEVPEPNRKRWQEDLVFVTSLMSLVSFLGIPYAFLSQQDVGLAFVLPIIPFLLGTAMSPLLDPSKNIHFIRASQAAAPVETIRAPKPQSNAGATALDIGAEGFSFLPKFADSLTRQPTEQKVLEQTLWLARRLTSSDSVVIFLMDDDSWSYWEGSKTEHQEAVLSALSAGRVEPVINRALRTKRAEFLIPEDDEENRVFVEEASALAIPMHDSGVIYLGRSEEQFFNNDEVDRLTVLGQTAHLALRIATASEKAERLAVSESDAREVMGAYKRGVREIVDLVRTITPLQERNEIIDRAGLGLGKIVAHDYWGIFFEVGDKWPPTFAQMGPPSKPKTDDEAVRKIVQRIRRRSMSVMENDVKESELPQPSKGTRSLVGSPLYSHGHCVGCVLLFSAKSDAFDEKDLDLVDLVAHQLGAILTVSEDGSEADALRAKLVQTGKMAAVGQLAAGVAHEVATPLGAMMMDLEGACKSLHKDTDKTKKRLIRALRSGEQLKKIAARLLFYSRESVVQEEETDLNQVVEESLEVMEHQLRVEDVDIQCELAEIDLVLGHRSELQQVVLNLLNNAKDAVRMNSSDSPRQIKITTSNHPRAVELAVADTGIGISEDDKAKVFEPFFTTKNEEGTGLGLSITKDLVEKHGGAIRVQSEPGKGSRFVLRLPKA